MGDLLNIVARASEWKSRVFVQLHTLADGLQSLSETVNSQIGLTTAIEDLRHSHFTLQSRFEELLTSERWRANYESCVFENEAVGPLRSRLGGDMNITAEYEVLLATRGCELLVALLPSGAADQAGLEGMDSQGVIARAVTDKITTAFVTIPDATGKRRAHPADEFLAKLKSMPSQSLAWAEARAPRRASPVDNIDTESDAATAASYFALLQQILSDIDCIDFYALGTKTGSGAPPCNIPFDKPAALPQFAPAEPKRRSVVLLHNNYYHFNVLADGLRSRGWDAITVSLESPGSPQQQFFHGEDINLFDADPQVMAKRTTDFFRTIPERFGALHFYGMGYPTFFTPNIENSERPRAIPWDFLELRRHRTIIGYMPSGCLEGGLQSSIRKLTGGLCSRCVWEQRPDVCNDELSLAWNRKLAMLCDWIGLECDHATPERIAPNTVYGPVVTTLDPDRWHPDIAVPDDMRIEREHGEILVYHAVGNYTTRRVGDRDIKGTGAILAAIDQLKAEGLPIKLIFAHDVPSSRVRFLQVQADIVVDQLNYGRYGANAREAMMLGRPTICRLSAKQAPPQPALRPIEAVPLVNAGEDSIVDVLRALVLDRDRRLELGRRGREFALAWHGQDACAERYERVIDRIRASLPPESPDLYPE